MKSYQEFKDYLKQRTDQTVKSTGNLKNEG